MANKQRKPPSIEFEVKSDVDPVEAQQRLDRAYAILFNEVAEKLRKDNLNDTGSFKSVGDVLPDWGKWRFKQQDKTEQMKGGDEA